MIGRMPWIHMTECDDADESLRGVFRQICALGLGR